MEITIDEHRAQLKKLKSFHNGSYGASINFASDIMRKYQKNRGNLLSSKWTGFRRFLKGSDRKEYDWRTADDIT